MKLKCCCFFTIIILTFPVSSRQLQLAVLFAQAFLTSVCHICVSLKRHTDGRFAKTNDPNVTFSHRSSVGRGVMTSCLRERMCGSRCFFLHKTIRGVSKITLDTTYKQTPAQKKNLSSQVLVAYSFLDIFQKPETSVFLPNYNPPSPAPTPCVLFRPITLERSWPFKWILFTGCSLGLFGSLTQK